MTRALVLALALLAALSNGCTKSGLLDFAMRTAPRPALAKGRHVGPYEVLAGDLHCHVLPPDSPSHVARTLDETVVLAKAEQLDFVVLTPHVPARFFARPATRARVSAAHAELRARLADLKSDVLFIAGMEYTDHRFGHVGLAFADLDAVLADVSHDDAPSRFFERWREGGGLAIINHPTLHGLRGSLPFRGLRHDMSWRPFDDPSRAAPSEIEWITSHATGIETYNTSISHLRDQFLLGDEELTLRKGAHLSDRVARAQHRRITPVGGSDSHGGWLRATTWVLATERSPRAIRDAIAEGRTCMRGAEACSFVAKAGGFTWTHVGGSLASGGAKTIAVRANGGAATYFVNGEAVAHANDGETVEVPVSSRCSLVRAIVGDSWSAPIHVDCDWAR